MLKKKVIRITQSMPLLTFPSEDPSCLLVTKVMPLNNGIYSIEYISPIIWIYLIIYQMFGSSQTM